MKILHVHYCEYGGGATIAAKRLHFAYLKENIDSKMFVIKKQSDNKNKSYGILGMKERASMLGGELEIISKQNKGTTIKVNLPIISN